MPNITHEEIEVIQKEFPKYLFSWSSLEDAYLLLNFYKCSRFEMEKHLQRPWRIIITRYQRLEGRDGSACKGQPKTPQQKKVPFIQKPKYYSLIQESLDKIKGTKDASKCTVFCSPIITVCEALCKDLELSDAVFTKCREIVKAMMTQGWYISLLSHSRICVAGGVVYTACHLANEPRTQNDLALVVNCNVSSIKDNFHQIIKLGNIQCKV
jgi:hypothetical protein